MQFHDQKGCFLANFPNPRLLSKTSSSPPPPTTPRPPQSPLPTIAHHHHPSPHLPLGCRLDAWRLHAERVHFLICDSEMSAEARGAALGEQCTILLSRPADFETTLVRRVLRDLPPKAPRRLQQVLELLLDCERAIRRSSRADGESAPQAAPPPRLLDRNAKLLLALRTLQRNALRAAPSLELRHLVSLGCEEGKTPHAPYKPPHPTHLTLSLTRRSHPLLLVHSPRPHPSEGLALALTLTIPAPSPSLPL